MNFYPHHIGDYLSATAHLTMLEDGAYRRLLDAYYTREAPLPPDVAACCRLVRAMSKDERAAVATVLREYFVQMPDGWRHNRCDREIERAHEAGQEGEQRRENEKERQRRHRERRKELFDQLRAHGVVPPFDTSTKSLQHLLKDVTGKPGSRVDNGDGNAPVTRDNTQTQRLTNTNTNTNTKLASLAAGAGAREETPAERAERVRLTAVAMAVEARKLGVEVTGSDPRLLKAAGQGITLATLVETIELVAKRQNGRPPNIGYVLGTLAGWATEAEGLQVKGASVPVRGEPDPAEMAAIRERLEQEERDEVS